MRDEFFAHFGWACSHTVQTVVAHIKELLSWSPPWCKVNRKDTAAHQGRTGVAGLLAANVARKPSQATTLSPSGGWRPSLFRQNKRISTQDYRDGRKDNSRCKLRDLFYF